MIRRTILGALAALVALAAAQPAAAQSFDPVARGLAAKALQQSAITGSSPGVLYDCSGFMCAAPGVTSDGSSLAIASGVQTGNYKSLSITQTWNNSGTLFDAPLFEDITDTASANNSVYVDFRRNGVTLFKIYGLSTNIVGGIYETWDGNGPVLDFHNANGAIASNGSPRMYFGTNNTVLTGVLGLSSTYSTTSDIGISRGAAGELDVGNGTAADASGTVKAAKHQVGSGTSLTLAAGELGFNKITASGSAAGASGGKMELVCGTNAGTAKLIAYAGTSTTAVTLLDNIGAGVTGC